MTDAIPSPITGPANTARIRLDYAYLGGTNDERQYDTRAKRFDAWLAQHDREVWAQGEEAGSENQCNWDGWRYHGDFPRKNPYGTEQA